LDQRCVDVPAFSVGRPNLRAALMPQQVKGRANSEHRNIATATAVGPISDSFNYANLLASPSLTRFTIYFDSLNQNCYASIVHIATAIAVGPK